MAIEIPRSVREDAAKCEFVKTGNLSCRGCILDGYQTIFCEFFNYLLKTDCGIEKGVYKLKEKEKELWIDIYLEEKG